MEVMAEPSSYESMIKIPSLATRKFKDATMFANYLVRNGYRFLQAACNSALENVSFYPYLPHRPLLKILLGESVGGLPLESG